MHLIVEQTHDVIRTFGEAQDWSVHMYPPWEPVDLYKSGVMFSVQWYLYTTMYQINLLSPIIN